MAGIEEGTVTVDGVEAFYRRAPGEGTPVLYCHGNPGHGEEWLPLMERGGPALAIDMPGWGRSARPDPARFDYSMYGLSSFLERCLEELGVGRRKLVVHDWGGLTLIGAQRRPELVERMVLINCVPLLPGYRWHWIAQIWRRRFLGEAFNATARRSIVALLLRQATGDRGPAPEGLVELIWSRWDAGTAAALLALYRHADPRRLARAGARLERLECPALVLWADRDPYLPARFGDAYAAALPNARLERLHGGGHWPHFELPELSERVLEFVE